MSSSNQQKKKQDERNSKLVRELAALPANKYCFECGQRGPTYVNITNGSFCCMHCSGLLRGLNPPQRVKSISMATFSNDEIEKVKSMGNEENAKIWLGLHDGPVKFDVRSDEAVKQHLIQKYERKRWYVSPSEIAEQRRLLEAHSRRDSSSGISVTSHKSNQSAPANLQPEKKNDLMDILGGDLMFPVKEEPASTIPSAIYTAAFTNRSTAAPPLFPPLSFPSTTPLSSHSNTPQQLQFDIFGAPSVQKVLSPPRMQSLPQQHDTMDLFDAPSVPVNQPKVQDNFANFDAAFNSFSLSDIKPVAHVPSQQISNGFNGFPTASIPPSQPPSVLEPINLIQPLEHVKMELKKEAKKDDDGLPDYSALEALYKAEDEPVDFFGFGKPNKTANNASTTTLSLSATNGFAKSSTVGNFGYQSPFPSSNNFGNPNVSSNTGLTPNSFSSMNNFPQPSGFSTTSQAPAPWLPTTNNGNATTATEPPSTNWNPFS